MRDVVYLDQIEQAEVLLKPQRIEVLRQLAEPRSCTEVAVELDQTPQRVYYHVKRLLEAVQADVAALDLTRPDLPSIGVSGDIRVRSEQRKAFLDELQQTLQDLFTRYGGAEGDAFRLAVACYPTGDPDDRA